MKIISNRSRRKKIRTRKSLNEIRKRSRRLLHPETKPTKAADVMGNNQKHNHFVTSNRLTLAMFPNAVRSETVTRYNNDEIKKKLDINLKNLIHDGNDLSIDKSEDGNCSSCQNNVQRISGDEEQKSDVNFDSLESPEVVEEENNTPQSSPQNDVSPPTNCIHDKYYLYEQFMSEISPYLNKTVAKSLLTENVIDNLKQHLLSLKIQSHNITLKHKPTMTDIHISNESDIMVEDPMDYIRLSYTAMENTSQLQSVCSTGTSKSVDSLLHLHSLQAVPSSTSRTDMSDTPEYIYFPHKLN